VDRTGQATVFPKAGKSEIPWEIFARSALARKIALGEKAKKERRYFIDYSFRHFVERTG
jgi:hypothetical protein